MSGARTALPTWPRARRVSRPTARGLGLLMLALSLSACSEGPLVQPNEWTEGPGYRYRDLAVRGDGAGFRPVAESGLDFVNVLSDKGIVQNRHRMNGSGVAVGDVDGDGRPDIFFAAMESQPSLYRNLGGWQFENATAAAGLTGAPNYSTGAVFADVDGDADLDLFVTALTAPNQLWLNDGAGGFSLAEAGLGSNRGSMSAAFADTDGDGDLDLYVANYKRIAARDSLSPELLLFDALTGLDGQVIPEMQDHFRIEERDGRPLRLELGEEDQYYLNRGDGTFEPAAIPGVDRDWGLGVTMQDLSGDGIPDLYVANDFESPDYFLLGDGQGGWLADSPVMGHSPNSSMSVAVADVDHDGRLDIFVPDMRSPDPMRSRFQAGTAAPADTAGTLQYMQNALYLGGQRAVLAGDEPSRMGFADAAWAWGVAATEWSWSGIFLDVDLDGWDDLLVSTGHSFDVQDVDAQAREREAIRGVRSVDGFRRLLLDYPRLDLPNGAYRNVGGERFEAVAEGWGMGAEADITHGMALGDFDGDGDLDLVTSRLNKPAGLFENRSSAPRIAIRLAPTGDVVPGQGVTVCVANSKKEMVVGGQYLSGSEPLLVFAAPSDSFLISLVSSGRHRYIPAQSNRVYELSSLAWPENGAPKKQPPPTPVGIEIAPARSARGALAGEAASHPLIPRPLNPGRPIATGDLNGDGQDELLLGGMITEAATVRGANYPLAISPVRWSDAAIAKGRVYATVMGAAGSVRIQVMEPGLLAQDLKLPLTGSAQLAVDDLDGDGRLDAFVGARGARGRYPESESSLLLRGAADGLHMGTPIEAGMVTGATFSDIDGDGDPDLAVSTDWGPVRLFINTDGVLSEQTQAWGLGDTAGLWQDIASGDVDGDGRQDLVASNWGWNSRYGRIGAPDHTAPGLRLYYDDHDGDGIPDPVEAEYRADLQAWSPVADFNTLRSAVPVLGRRVSTWHAYSEASVQKLFGQRTAVHEVTTLATTVFLNRGGHFEAVPLPAGAQRSPGQGVVLEDLDDDGRADIYLSQNVFDFNLGGTARQDAGTGLMVSWSEAGWDYQSLGLFGDQDDIVVWRGSPVVSLRDGSVYRIQFE